jgi:hypothetical protein
MTVRNNDNILVHYKKTQEYSRTDNNAIGATASTTLRTITTPSGTTTNYVRKFGTPYLITDITGDSYGATRSTAGNGWKFEFRTVTSDTLLYTITDDAGVVTVTDGSTVGTAEALYIKLIWLQGTMNVVNGTNIAINTNGNPDAYNSITVLLPGEALTTANYDVSLYVSSSGSTYYDANYKTGGYRHTPVVGDSRFPYFNPTDADSALGARTIVHVLDSEHYQVERYTVSSGATWQAALGHTPTLFYCAGPNVNLIFFDDSNNSNTIYVDATDGLDANDGSYFAPKKTLQGALYTTNPNYSAPNFVYVVVKADSVFVEPNKKNNSAATNVSYKVMPAPGVTASVVLSLTTGSLWLETTSSGSAADLYNITVDCAGTQGVHQNIVGGPPNNAIINKNCHFLNCATAFLDMNYSNTASYCIFENAGAYAVRDGAIDVGEVAVIENSIFAGGSGTGILTFIGTGTVPITNNLIYGFAEYGVHVGSTVKVAISGCTITGCGVGVYQPSASSACTITNSVVWGNTLEFDDLSGNGFTVSYSIYSSVSPFADGGNNTTNDPLYLDEGNNNYYLERLSDGYHSASDTLSKGLRNYMLLISSNGFTLNGFFVGGAASFGVALTQTALRTGTTIKWCTPSSMEEAFWDSYAGGNAAGSLQNCYIYECGNGALFSNGQNTVSECVITKNIKYGLWMAGTSNSVTNASFYGNHSHIYAASGFGGVIKDNIFEGASSYGIISITLSSVSYCCVADATYDANVDISDSSNVLDSALYVGTTTGNEDYHIKTLKGGFAFDSPCYETSSTGGDMGAYDVAYSLAEYSFRKYHFEENPLTNPMDNIIKGNSKFTSITGDLTLYGDYHKRVFTMQFSNYTTKTQRDMISYFNGFYPTRENRLVRDDCIMLYHLLPNTFLLSSTGTLDHATYWDSTDKQARITDASETWIEDQWRGWSVGIKFETATNAVIDATAKTITKTGAFTGDDYTDYFVYIDNDYYVITSNTNDALTVSDAKGTLTSQTVDVSLEKYFKIVSNDTTYMTIYDPENELSGLDGSYDYYIDFIEIVTQKDNQQYSQARFSWTEERTKSNYVWTVEEA